MRGKNFLAALTATAMVCAATVSSGFSSVFAADGLGGFTWEATSGYQEGTTAVTNSNGTVSVSFEDVDNSLHIAGFCAPTDSADWSLYDTLSLTVENNSDSDVSYAMAINTGSSWDWHQCNAVTIAAGESKDLTFYLGAAEWWFNDELTAISNLYMVQRVNMMIMAPTEDATVSGSVTISNWELASNADSNPVEPKDGFYVDGTVLRDANQNAFEMRGTNYAYTWYKWAGDEEQAIAEIAGYGANTIRIVLSNGAQYEKDSAGVVEHLIELCEKYNVVAVLEVHDVTGKDDESSLLGCAEYFAELKSVLIGHEDTTIINIANEWQGSTNNSAWESAYIKAVKIIRDAGLTHCIMCDAGGWGQGYSTVHAGGNAVLEADPEKNVMFSVHMYGTAGGSASTIKTVIDGAMTRNLTLCIGEFGYNHSDGDVDEDYIMQYCDEVGIGWLSWSWYGNGSPVEYLDMSNAQVGGTLSDWGDEVINGPYGWKATAETCSVFTGSSEEETTTTTAETTTTTTTTETTTTTTETTTTTSETTTTTTTAEETTTSESTTTTTEPEAGILYGDVNSDATINIVDLVRLARYISQDNELNPAFTDAQRAAADMNSDTFVDSTDLTLLSNRIAGL